jgi:hypothetical protein
VKTFRKYLATNQYSKINNIKTAMVGVLTNTKPILLKKTDILILPIISTVKAINPMVIIKRVTRIIVLFVVKKTAELLVLLTFVILQLYG